MNVVQNSTAETSELRNKVSSHKTRYFQFAILLLAAGAIYPLLYLRQNFENTLLAAMNITAEQLGNQQSILGIIYVVTYIPSGWLADRFTPKYLISFSVGAVGLLGFWYATCPSYRVQMLIFIGWGLCAGLTFWASLIKAVNLIATKDEQGRFFGILDGARGLVEAILATVAVAIFTYYMAGTDDIELGKQGFHQVILLYSTTCIIISFLILAFLSNDFYSLREGYESESSTTPSKDKIEHPVLKTLSDLKIIFSIPQVWLMMFIILTGYMQFWATYSVSTFLQSKYSASATVAAFITMTKLWMRPIGGIGGGFLADWISRKLVLGVAMIIASISLVCFAHFPATAGSAVLIIFIIIVGISTYAIRGVYWSLLEDCAIPVSVVGLGIGVISMVGYTPDIFLPQINSIFVKAYPGLLGRQLYFDFIALCGFIGAITVFLFKPRKSS